MAAPAAKLGEEWGPGPAREAAGVARFCEFCPWRGGGRGRARRAVDGEEAVVEEAGEGRRWC